MPQSPPCLQLWSVKDTPAQLSKFTPACSQATAPSASDLTIAAGGRQALRAATAFLGVRTLLTATLPSGRVLYTEPVPRTGAVSSALHQETRLGTPAKPSPQEPAEYFEPCSNTTPAAPMALPPPGGWDAEGSPSPPPPDTALLLGWEMGSGIPSCHGAGICHLTCCLLLL